MPLTVEEDTDSAPAIGLPARPGLEGAPAATYRLQFNSDFTLAHARELVPYLYELGISHIYASPLLRAVRGSRHGYDICDFNELNPEVGTPEDFARLHEELARYQMGLVLDVVPNHMGIEIGQNRWWRDVLTHGRASRFAGCFDIDWEAADPRLRGKVALPILTERYDQALRHGTFRVTKTEESFGLLCGSQALPVSPESVAALWRQAAEWVPGDEAETLPSVLAEINGNLEELNAFIQKQNYLPMFWGNGDATLNYRRFFTISSLAGIRIEDEAVFERAFALVKEWLDRGWVEGLRVDHIDGLRNPEAFLRRLRQMATKSWIVLEKILEPEEPLKLLWPVNGTTGYDFLVNLDGVFIDRRGEKPLSDFYAEFTGESLDYPALVREKKRMLIRGQLATETSRLTEMLVQISTRHWECQDYTKAELCDAWTELAVCLPVYRTYVAPSSQREVPQEDASVIGAAAKAARQLRTDLPPELFNFLEELLLLRRPGDLEDDFVWRFQQLTGPVMAKSVEDTAFFCYPRFVALNEVGGDPSRFGLSLEEFHQFCQRQQKLWPGSMAATSTHDTKWGGDVRARLALLSERPREWMEAVRRWSQLNEAKRRHHWPDRKTEYLFYQIVAGAWPLTADRALSFMQKAAREAKEHTQWQQPAPDYEEALENFVKGALDDLRFVTEVKEFVSRLLDRGWINSLAQTLLKLTATGVPDIYQGAELWDLNLTDPDNRRPVDFALRREHLARAKRLSAADAWAQRESGLAKLWLIQKVLGLRRSQPDLFAVSAPYEPLTASGERALHVLAFARGKRAVTIVPRLVAGFDADWKDTRVAMPPGKWHNILTGKTVERGLMSELTAEFPVTLLVRKEEG